MLLFLCDLDNTLIFSHRHRKPGDVCVEWLEGREQSFMTSNVRESLACLQDVLLVPVTTRSVEQYRRIQWPKAPEWAVTTNGGILLGPSGPDPAWLEASRELAEPYMDDLARASAALSHEPWCLRRKIVDGLYLFSVSEDPETAESGAAGFRETGALSVAVSGRKTYFFPPGIHKGAAAVKLQERFGPCRTVCAGDSPLDLPMLTRAGTALVPSAELASHCAGDVRVCPEHRRFSDFVMDEVLRMARQSTAPQFF